MRISDWSSDVCSSDLAIATTGDVPKGSLQFVHDEATVALPLADVIDIAEERSRLQKEIAKADGEIAKLGHKLGNEQFLAKAPQEVVEEQRERPSETETAPAKLRDALERMPAP